MKLNSTHYQPTLEVSTTAYRFAYGARPAGRGYWAFVARNADGDETILHYPGEVLYGVAKKWAIQQCEILPCVVNLKVAT